MQRESRTGYLQPRRHRGIATSETSARLERSCGLVHRMCRSYLSCNKGSDASREKHLRNQMLIRFKFVSIDVAGAGSAQGFQYFGEALCMIERRLAVVVGDIWICMMSQQCFHAFQVVARGGDS